ncbi:MAG: tRNA-dependent cyclodipeptide synthase [Alphaproteobacteria bacterium]|nr:tRNA-dependent cyclodipeptide synthase [Alphaproteobacteria bacterium]
MTAYKVIVCNSPHWRQHEAVTLGVSVPSPNWQGDKLASILNFAAANFQIIRIDVSDALYRHGFIAQGLTDSDALCRANNMGAKWLEQNADAIGSLRIKPMIVRWAEWYSHPDYQETLAGFQSAYDSNSVLKNALQNDIMAFYRRRNRPATEKEFAGSLNFFIEELAVITIQTRELPGVKFYPGYEPHSFKIVKSGLVPEAPSGLNKEQFARLKFQSRPNNRPKTTLKHKHFLGAGM